MPRYLFPALITAGAPRSPTRLDKSTPVDWSRTPLEKTFPHILAKIQVMWGYPEMNLYFSRLAVDDRGDRDGFPADVWDDLQMLMLLHQDLFPSH